MARLFALVEQRLSREDGQGMTEYAFLLVGIVAVVGIVVLAIQTGLVNTISGVFG